MAIDRTGGSKPYNKPKPPEPKPEPKPVAKKANTAKAEPKAAKAGPGARSEVKRQQARDGFDSGKKTSLAQRGQTAERLGSTTAPAAAQTVGMQDKSVLEKLGLTADDLKKAGQAALPHLEKAAQAVVGGHPEQALEHLRNAALASPEVAQKAIKGLAQNLPEGPAKTLLTDEKVAKELVTNNELHASVGKLLQNPGDTGAIRELLNNDKARDAVLGALSNDKSVKEQLAKVGLEPKDLVEAGKAAPKLWDAFDKLKAGDVKGGLTDIQAAVQAAPGLAAKIGEKIEKALPQGVKDQFAKLGITPEQIRTAGPALPHLYEAADAASKGDWGKAFNSLKEAAISAPDLTTQAMKGLAQQLPSQLGAVKTLLTNDAFLKEVVTNRDLHDQVGKLFNDSTRMEGLRGLLNNDKVRDTALTALGTDKGVQDALKKVGLEPKDLVEAGKAAPKLLDAAEKIQKGDVKGGLEDIQAAVQAAPGLAAKIGEKLEKLIPQSVKDQFAKLGITSEQIRTAGPALPHLYEAADAASKGDWGKAFNSLKEAAISAPDLTTQAMKGLAQQLPSQLGAVKTLLTNDAFLKEVVTNRDLHDQVGKLFNDSTRMEGLRGLLNNDKVRDTALTALGTDKGVQDALKKIGLEPKDLVEAGKAAPKLLDAFDKIQKGDVKGGLTDIQAAVQAAPGLAAKIGEKIEKALPQSVKDQFAKLGITPEQIRTAGPALPHLYEAADAATKGDWGKAFNSLKEAAISAPDLTTQAMKGLAQQLPSQLGAAKTLLTDDAFLKQVVTNRDLHDQVGKLFNEGTRLEGLRGLLGNDAARDAALTALGNDPKVQEMLTKAGLDKTDLLQAGKAAPHLFDAVNAFSEGKIDDGITALGKAGEAAPELLNKIGEKLISKLPEGLRTNITNLGITPSELLQAGKALPDLLKAGQALGQGDFQVALKSLKDAASKMPPSIIEKAITTTAGKLSDQGFAGVAKSLLTDKDFVHQLVTNKDLHAAFDKMMSGDLVQGTKDLLKNQALATAAGNALAKNAGLMEKLKPFGIQDGKDIASLGGAIFDVMQAGQQLASGDPGAALKSLGQALADVPPDLRGRMTGALAEKLHVPEWAKDTLVAATSLLGNEAVGKALGDAFGALQRGDLGGFVAGIATTGKAIAQTAPEAAKAFLNSLAKIPGSLGKLFSDHELNAAMVDSGAVTNLFEAAEKLAHGDVGGALSEIAQAGGALLTQGDHFEVAGQKLPFGRQGIENLTRMFGRFVDALPDKLKESITKEATKFAAKAGLKSVPILGNIVSAGSAIGSAKDLWDELHKDPKDALNIALTAGQLGLDIAGVVPGLNSITGPLQIVLGTAKVIKGASDLIGDIHEFQQGLIAA
ncbi:hypothetical protein [Vitiosangium sp. GDMCC 1.1324]|uniref:hypothetical protein n=1 Tax=Vitiosangium sp. (strain GDMCC 1.1324) TaxID=2138576 RepID=UPI000D38DC4C|nr:hypothetical protein [Vitiosangium sp. GDMCC 1.1324]PTL83184.1 hypothetical protein DAT35_14365 [Vitiosangium sp. GDMCC 1.1324]